MTYSKDPFPHLDVKTNFSLDDSVVDIDKMSGFKFVGIADNNTFGWLKLQNTRNVHPIFGVRHDGYIHYAKNNEGLELFYRNADIKEYDRNIISICLDIEQFNHYFVNNYIALSRINSVSDILNIDRNNLAIELGLPVVAINSPRFIYPEDYPAQRIRECIANKIVMNSCDDDYTVSKSQYFKTHTEMSELFDDIPSAIENAYAIAEMCSARMIKHEPKTPSFTGNRTTDDNILYKAVHDDADEFISRISYEYGVISKMGFSGYFLIVSDFCAWARKNNVPVGVGRGSGAGSLVAYRLGITDVDPIKYNLLFERFLNPDRVSLPDFDIDFCPEGRDKVIAYCKKKYGRQNVAVISTIGTMADKSAIHAASRAYGTGISGSGLIDQSMQANMRLDNILEDVMSYSRMIINYPSNISKHAAGVVIDDDPVYQKCPVFNSAGSCTGLEMKEVESLGLVKFDFLGLKTLTQIQNTCINAGIDVYNIPEEMSKKECHLIAAGFTDGLFQIESHGMVELVKDVKPKTIEELSDCIALFRPGPIESGMMTDYVSVCQGLKPESIFDGLGVDDVLRPTKGQLIYQEQVMEIARQLAGFTYAEADLLRRAMGKKIASEMAVVRKKFIKACKLKKKKSEKIFDAIEKFAGYGFNKSHSISYATICHQTAWLKAHYPLEFYAATLSLNMGNVDTLMMMISHARRNHGIKFAGPSIRHSKRIFSIEDDYIRCGLEAVKHVSAGLATKIEKGDIKPYKYPKQAREHLQAVGALGFDWDAKSERKGLGFNLMKRPVQKRNSLFVHDLEFKLSKRGNQFCKLIVVNYKCLVSEILIAGNRLDQYKSSIDKGCVLNDVELKNAWVERIGSISNEI